MCLIRDPYDKNLKYFPTGYSHVQIIDLLSAKNSVEKSKDTFLTEHSLTNNS